MVFLQLQRVEAFLAAIHGFQGSKAAVVAACGLMWWCMGLAAPWVVGSVQTRDQICIDRWTLRHYMRVH